MTRTDTTPAATGSAKAAPSAHVPSVGFVSLGCPKALVDSERILTQLRAEGYAFSPSYEGADVVIVNTCGFLDTARDESLQAIGEAMAENGKVIVTGCLGAEPEVIREKFPHVMSITGPAQYETVVNAVHEAVPPVHDPLFDLLPPGGVKLTPRHYAYLKISEGCNNRCSFCIIPSMRGDLASRPAGDVMAEAERLVQAGVKEILVISQDTSSYGIDVKYADSVWDGKIGAGRNVKTKFYDLAEALGELGVWVRLHYVYPYPHVDKAIELMAQGKILPYLDIPFQHASPKVLRAMKRPGDQEKTLGRIKKWREICPELIIRSTFIVGFPGETEEDFQMLLDWLQEAQLDRVGCFKFEPVEGATANELTDIVPEEIKEERWHRFMAVQQEISAARLQRKVGTTMQVLVDEITEDGIIARSAADAPEIDGVVHLAPLDAKTSARLVPGGVRPGSFVLAQIDEADAYDLFGQVVGAA